MRLLRTFHGWIGVFLFPWIIIIGATGLYLNHARTVLPVLNGPSYDESRFDDWQVTDPVTGASARALAMTVWPNEPIKENSQKIYHDRPSFQFKKASGRIIVTQPTGHYFVKTRYTRRTYAPDGELLHTKIYWGSIFKGLHRAGWLGGGLGTWLADITSVAMVIFGFSGAVMWWMPRTRRLMRALGRRG